MVAEPNSVCNQTAGLHQAFKTVDQPVFQRRLCGFGRAAA